MDENSPNPISHADEAPPAATTFEPAEPLKDTAVDFTPDAAGTARSAAGAAKEQAQGLTQQASDRARAFAGQGKDKATDALGQLSTLLEDAAGQVDERLGGQFGQYARQAAGSVQGFADELREKDVDDIVDDVRELVRKSPGVAIGAAAAIGFVVARLLSSGLDQRDA